MHPMALEAPKTPRPEWSLLQEDQAHWGGWPLIRLRSTCHPGWGVVSRKNCNRTVPLKDIVSGGACVVHALWTESVRCHGGA